MKPSAYGCWHRWRAGPVAGWFLCEQCSVIGVCQPCLEEHQQSIPHQSGIHAMRCQRHGGDMDLGQASPVSAPKPSDQVSEALMQPILV